MDLDRYQEAMWQICFCQPVKITQSSQFVPNKVTEPLNDKGRPRADISYIQFIVVSTRKHIV